LGRDKSGETFFRVKSSLIQSNSRCSFTTNTRSQSLTNKNKHCKQVLCNTLTHSTNEDLLNMKHKGDAKSRTLSHTSDTTETRNPCVIKVILLACSTYIDFFKKKYIHQYVKPCEENARYTFLTIKSSLCSHIIRGDNN
jgi:hypothetical protein